MNLWDPTLWTWSRSLVLALLSIPLVAILASGLNSCSTKLRRCSWFALLLPLLTPGFLVGYAYGRGILALREWQWWNELIYACLSLFRWIPLGVLTVTLAPPGVLSETAWHCWKLSQQPDSSSPGSGSVSRKISRSMQWCNHIGGRKYLPAAAVIFLMIFHDFDLAALMGASSWSVWLFDAQATGLSLTASFRALAYPMLLQILTLTPLWLFITHTWTRGTESQPSRLTVQNSPSFPARIFTLFWVSTSAFLGSLLPWVLIAWEGKDALPGIWTQGTQWLGLGQEAANGLIVGGTAAFIATSFSRWLSPDPLARHATSRNLCQLFILPGLSGPLAIALVCLGISQQSWLYALLPRGWSWLAALVVWLIPSAILLQFAARNLHSPAPFHLATLLSASPDSGQRKQGWGLTWKLRGDEWLWTIAPLVYQACFDLTISSLLAPPGSVSAPVRLFNQMHYGHGAMLSALTAGAVLIPLALFLTILFVRHQLVRGLTR